MSKLVSAVITTHNRQDLLVRAVKSVLCQTYKNLELIVVDDASEERADELLKEFNLQYIYIPKEESKGGNHARNKGILSAKGEYIAFLDDDDYWLPEKTEKQVLLLECNDCDLVYCGRTIEFITKDGIKYKKQIPLQECTGNISGKILQEIYATTSCIMVKRQKLIDIGMFDESLRFWQEYELQIRLAQFHPFLCVCEPLVMYRCDNNDSQRLTNKYYLWKIAVKYIHHKHQSLYQNQSLIEKIGTWQMTTYDAIGRTKSSGLTFLSVYLKTLLYITHIPRKAKKAFLLFFSFIRKHIK